MAQPIDFPEKNSVRTAPPDMKNCADLHVHVVGDGRVISCWELTGDELQRVLETKRIWLTVWGSHPPACIEGISPFEESTE